MNGSMNGSSSSSLSSSSQSGIKRKNRDFDKDLKLNITNENLNLYNGNSSNGNINITANNINNINNMNNTNEQLLPPPKKKQRTISLKGLLGSATMNTNTNNNNSNGNGNPTVVTKKPMKLKISLKRSRKDDTNNNNNSNNSDIMALKAKAKAKAKFKHDEKQLMNSLTNFNQSQSMEVSQIGKELESKKRKANAQLMHADLFPYVGPKLTRLAPRRVSYPITIPSYSRWFSLNRIHSIEYQSLRDIFGNRSMEYHKRYMDIRNFLISTWRMNPRIYLSVTACRKLLSCDSGKLLTIHRFLEKWGLINYLVDDGSIPMWEPPMVDYTHVETPFGIRLAIKESNVNSRKQDMQDTQDIQESTNDKKKTKNKNESKNEKKELKDNKDSGNSNSKSRRKDISKELYDMRENIIESGKSRFNLANSGSSSIGGGCKCSICGNDCSVSRYRCLAETSMIICAKWYVFLNM